MLEKLDVYCRFISRKCDDEKLVDRCRKYLDELSNFYKFKYTSREVNNDRREKEKWLDMRKMRI